MNTPDWIQYFLTNRHRFAEPALPWVGTRLDAAIRRPLAESLAIFQLGETGGGTRLMRYVREVVPADQWCGYEEAVSLFIAEEHHHAALLGRMLDYLGGKRLSRQWSNSVFRWVRFHFGIEFNIQVLLVAELIAEVYYGVLYRKVPDEKLRACCHKILRDEMRHIAFHTDFLGERLKSRPAWWRAAWRVQCLLMHHLSVCAVAWDHRRCLRALGLSPMEFASLAFKPGRRFFRRLEKHRNFWAPNHPLRSSR